MTALGMFYYYGWNPLYWMMIGPAMLLALWAHWRVKSAYARAGEYNARSGLSGAEAAERILSSYGIRNVAIEPVHTFLGDHYDSRHKVLRLSPDVYHGRSLASLGIAAHEVGHAIQDAHNYGPLAVRNGLVPMATVGSHISFFLIIIGLVLSSLAGMGPVGRGLAIGGLALFGAVVVFQLVNLPVEFNASSRAKAILLDQGMITQEEYPLVSKVLSAAAMTYVAATITALLQLLYWAIVVFNRRN